MTKLIHEDLTYTIRGVLFDVHTQLGPLLPEEFYQQAVEIGLAYKGVNCKREKSFEVYYRRQQVGLYYVDLWIEEGKLLLELKVAPQLLPLHQAQAISYLKVTDADLALLVNFGGKSLEVKRLPNFLRDKQIDFEWNPHLSHTGDMPYPELTNHILEICHRVHFELGPGFLHQIYRRAAMIELHRQNLSYQYLKQAPIIYQGQTIGVQEIRLIVVAGKIPLATVAVKQIDEAIKARLRLRLKHLGYTLGLLANFNSTALEIVTVRL